MFWLPIEVDPNSVRAGWLPLLLVIGIGVVIGLLYWSMRHEMKKITVPRREELEQAEALEADEAASTRS